MKALRLIGLGLVAMLLMLGLALSDTRPSHASPGANICVSGQPCEITVTPDTGGLTVGTPPR